jgi:5-formyltetrahydrofolate cyclo-ligase
VSEAARKRVVREAFRAARRALDPITRAHETASAIARIDYLVGTLGDVPLASYLAMPEELDLEALHRRHWATGQVVWLPRVAAPDHLDWHPVSDPAQTARGAYGIREPDPSLAPAAPLPPQATVLVPGVAFTRDGRRLGMGKGFYDRALAHHPGSTIGVGFTCQCANDLPTEPHDRRMLRVVLGGTSWPV